MPIEYQLSVYGLKSQLDLVGYEYSDISAAINRNKRDIGNVLQVNL